MDRKENFSNANTVKAQTLPTVQTKASRKHYEPTPPKRISKRLLEKIERNKIDSVQNIDQSMLRDLQNAGYLNWWTQFDCDVQTASLFPLITIGNGNCLLNATSLFLYGYQDENLEMRNKLHFEFSEGRSIAALKKIWQQDQQKTNSDIGFTQTQEELDKEWEGIIEMSSALPHSTFPLAYHPLERIHIYTLAQIIRRPIIIIANKFIFDNYNMPLSPVNYNGIYLPDLVLPEKCVKSPVLLSYNDCHFTPLSYHNSEVRKLYIPIVNRKLEFFPVHFGDVSNIERYLFTEVLALNGEWIRMVELRKKLLHRINA